MIENIAKELGIALERIHLVGSTLIVGKGKDTDYLCLLDDPEIPEKLGYEPDLEEPRYRGKFRSWRRGKVNLLVATDPIYFASEVTIAIAAAVFNQGRWELDEREDRLQFHGFVRQRFAEHMGSAEPDPFDDIFG